MLRWCHNWFSIKPKPSTNVHNLFVKILFVFISIRWNCNTFSEFTRAQCAMTVGLTFLHWHKCCWQIQRIVNKSWRSTDNRLIKSKSKVAEAQAGIWNWQKANKFCITKVEIHLRSSASFVLTKSRNISRQNESSEGKYGNCFQWVFSAFQIQQWTLTR